MVSNTMSYKVTAFGLSDIGLVRQNNEDYWNELPEILLYVLADGMGGHRAGEIASREAVHALMDILEKTLGSSSEVLDLNEMHGIIHYAIEHANESIYRMSKQDRELRGMGTTLCCLLFNHQGLVYAHVGDSRIYRFRNNKLDLLTKDDSLISQMGESGKLKNPLTEEALYKGIITKAIGTEREVDPSVNTTEVKNHDIYLMCTDGLTDMLSLKEIEMILSDLPNIKEAGQTLVNRAKEKGGFDNITVVLTEIEEIHAS